MEYIYIVIVNDTLEFSFDELSDALDFISICLCNEVSYNSYKIHQKEVEE